MGVSIEIRVKYLGGRRVGRGTVEERGKQVKEGVGEEGALREHRGGGSGPGLLICAAVYVYSSSIHHTAHLVSRKL
jgi:hypothetical protein